MTKKNKLVCCGIISSLKQLKSSVILLRSPERCTDLITSRHPKSQSPCLQLICQQMCQNTSSGCWSSRSVYQWKNLRCPLLFVPVEHGAVQRASTTVISCCSPVSMSCLFVTPWKAHQGCGSWWQVHLYRQTCLGKLHSCHLADF